MEGGKSEVCQWRGSGGIPDSEQARIRDRNVRREERRAAAGDGDWNLEYVSNRIVVSGRGADEVRFTGGLLRCAATAMTLVEKKKTTRKRDEDRNTKKVVLLFKASPLHMDLEQIALD